MKEEKYEDDVKEEVTEKPWNKASAVNSWWAQRANEGMPTSSKAPASAAYAAPATSSASAAHAAPATAHAAPATADAAPQKQPDG